MVFPIVIYHEIFDDNQINKEKHAIHVAEFERHISYLADNGFESLNLAAIFRSDYGHEENSHKCLVISFDDGHYSDYSHAFRILKRYNFVGNFFITTDWVCKAGYLSWDNLTEMKDGSMSIQSHSISHSFLPDLSIPDLRKELRNSKRILEERLNIPVDFISIPSGFVSKRAIQKGKTEGYKGICTSAPGLNETENQAFLVLNRVTITRKTSFDTFKRIVNGDVKLIRELRTAYNIKSAFRNLIGNKLYYKLWSMYFNEV